MIGRVSPPRKLVRRRATLVRMRDDMFSRMLANWNSIGASRIGDQATITPGKICLNGSWLQPQNHKQTHPEAAEANKGAIKLVST
jgi:hypothetical protein